MRESGYWGRSSLWCLSQYEPEATQDPGVRPSHIKAHLRASAIKATQPDAIYHKENFLKKLDLSWKGIESYLQIAIS